MGEQSSLALLAEALRRQQRERWQAGERLPAETYLQQHPELQAAPDYALELIYHEVVLRQEQGETPPLEEYLQRFPQFAGQLKPLFDVHRALEADLPLQSAPTQTPTGAIPAPIPAAVSRELPVIPGYEMIKELGRGGMGVVYWAWQTSLNRTVALKMVLAGSHAGPQELARFRTEAAAVARLHHPNIVQIYEVGRHGAHPYMTLEYVEGGSLAQKLAGTPLAARQAAQLVETLARAVHSAHECGIIHRDLTPGNVLLTADGAPKITDFGLAKLLVGGGEVQTQSGAIVGTPSYMAPEQAAGKSKEIGPATDVYALGTMLYEMLTGRPPFRAETPLETLVQVQAIEPVPPSRLQPRLPRDLATICLKCLEKEPSKRYPSALALAEDLRRFLADEPIQARPVGHTEKAWRWCRRNPAVAALVSSVIVLLVLAAVGSFVAAVWLKDERDLVRANLVRAETAEGEKTQELYRSHLEAARAGRLTGREGQGLRGLEMIQRITALLGVENLTAGQLLDLRNEAIACLATPDVRVVVQQESEDKVGRGGYAFDTRLERWACIDLKGRLVIRRVADNQVVAQLPRPPGNYGWAHSLFSSDGRFVAINYLPYAGAPPCVVWDLQTGKRVLQVAVGDALSFDFRHDSRVFAAATTDGTICLYQLPEGRPIERFGEKFFRTNIRFDPTGRQLACLSRGTHKLDILEVPTGILLASFAHHAPLSTADWSPDGRWLAAGCADHRVYVYDMRQHRLHSVLEGHEADVLSVAFCPVGDLLASSSWDSTFRLWDPVSGKQWVRMAVDGNASPHFSPDGQRLGFKKESSFGVWELCGRQVCRTLHDGALGNRTPWVDLPTSYGVDFSPDGRLLASASWDGVRLWDTAADRQVAHLLARGLVESVQFDPKGGGLVTYGRSGLYYWPIEAHDASQKGSIQIGPARALAHPSSSWNRCAWDAKGRLLGFVESNQHRAVIVKMDDPATQIVLPERSKVKSIALSPDGKWAAAAAHLDSTVQVWDTATGKMAARLPGSQADDFAESAVFSPDNQWLTVGSASGYRWWRVGSWEPGPQITKNRVESGDCLAFSRDGGLLAIAPTPQEVRLVDPGTRVELATLTAADRHIISWMCFSPDGCQLAAATQHSLVQLWDLRTIRARLAALGLDWDRPPYPPKTDTDTARTIQVKVEPGMAAHAVPPTVTPSDLRREVGIYSFALALDPFNFGSYLRRASAHSRLGEVPQAIDDYKWALMLLALSNQQRVDQAQARVCNSLAWLYVTAPEKLRDPNQALPLAQKAVRIAPENSNFRNTLGVVYYRLGQWDAALETLERDPRDNAHDLFFLAMCYEQLGEHTKARQRYDRALRWWQSQGALIPPDEVEELNAFRAEAAALLKIASKPSS